MTGAVAMAAENTELTIARTAAVAAAEESAPFAKQRALAVHGHHCPIITRTQLTTSENNPGIMATMCRPRRSSRCSLPVGAQEALYWGFVTTAEIIWILPRLK